MGEGGPEHGGIETETPRDEDASGRDDTTRSVRPAWTYYGEKCGLVTIVLTMWLREGAGPGKEDMARLFLGCYP